MNVGATALGDSMPAALTTLFNLYPGLQASYVWLRNDIETTAGNGARAAVKPYIYGAYALGGLSLLVGTIALLRRR